MSSYNLSKTTKPWMLHALDVLKGALDGPIPTEPNELDWKNELSPKKERLAEHLSAFGNHAGGGFLVFGIDSTKAEVVGVSRQQADQIVNQLANLGRDAVEPALSIDHSITRIKGHGVLFVQIPEQAVRPVHLRGKSIEHAWIRSGGTTRKASRHEIGALLLNSQPLRWEKLRASSLLRVEDVDEQLNIRTIAALLERPLPSDSRETLKWLANERIIELHGNRAYVTNFGAIAAARELGQFESLSRKRIRTIHYRGLNKVDTIDERIEDAGYAVAFEKLISELKLVLPHSEVIKAALRTETAVYPDIAIRELIANALIHQDFTIYGSGPMIEIFDNRIEFTSPGRLLPGKVPDRLIGTTPQSRNELLASAFRRYHLCEERGTGFQKVVNAVELYGMPPVSFVPAENAFTVILFKPRKFGEMSQSERIEAAYQHAVLKYLSSSALTNTSLRERLKMSERQRNQVTNLISEAVYAGRIKRKDPNTANKFAEYLPYWA